MIHIDNTTEVSLDVALLEEITNKFTSKDIELLIIDSQQMQEINLEQRGFDKTTDVLSFPLDEMPHTPLGCIVINSELSQQKAQEFGHSLTQELTLMYIHGLLHVIGYDHESDEGQMRAKEEELISEFNLPQSLIVRMGE